nr:MAG TPA: hypothetical protein [Bacteriophage sp.]
MNIYYKQGAAFPAAFSFYHFPRSDKIPRANR